MVGIVRGEGMQNVVNCERRGERKCSMVCEKR
jgi:hypothetical protein